MQTDDVLSAGGSTARPTASSVGSIASRNCSTPSLAFARSAPCIDPVRSRTIITSNFFELHGEHAVARARTVKESFPMTFAKIVGTTEVVVT